MTKVTKAGYDVVDENGKLYTEFQWDSKSHLNLLYAVFKWHLSSRLHPDEHEVSILS